MGLMSGSDLRAKSSRVITYEEFKKALEELAPRRFKGQSKEEALQSIFRLVANKEPANVGVTVRTPPPPPPLSHLLPHLHTSSLPSSSSSSPTASPLPPTPRQVLPFSPLLPIPPYSSSLLLLPTPPPPYTYLLPTV